MNPHDHQDLTAHVLGELDAEHGEAMSHWIAENPEAGAEAEQVKALAEHLHRTAPVAHLRLLPHQRDAVLNAPQRVRQLVAQASNAGKRRPSIIVPVLQSAFRIAVAAVLIIAGFIVGTRFSVKTASPEVASTVIEKSSVATVVKAPISIPPLRAKELPAPIVADVPAAKMLEAESPKPAATASVVVATAALVSAPPPIKDAQTYTTVLAESFVSTTKATVAQSNVRPSVTRPVIAKQGPAAAAPITNNARAIQPAATAKQPELLIHSWKAEVASCPWDETHRLLRVVLQIPGEQPGASSDQLYPLRATFDPNTVRSFRRLSQRTVPAAAADQPAFHVAWYEFVPNGQARDGVARAVGSVTLANARFTTAAMAAFDGSTLRVLDSGAKWNEAGEDFIFESAISGFGLLLKGAKDTGTLNHALVLDLAQHAATSAVNGERAKFVKLVQDAQRAAGL